MHGALQIDACLIYFAAFGMGAYLMRELFAVSQVVNLSRRDGRRGAVLSTVDSVVPFHFPSSMKQAPKYIQRLAFLVLVLVFILRCPCVDDDGLIFFIGWVGWGD